MSIPHHALAGALLCTMLVGGPLAAHAAPAKSCHFGHHPTKVVTVDGHQSVLVRINGRWVLYKGDSVVVRYPDKTYLLTCLPSTTP
jgi:hypothetical protein